MFQLHTPPSHLSSLVSDLLLGIGLLAVWIITNCGKLLDRWEYQTILPVSWETCMWVKKQQLEACMEQLISSRLRKECDRAVCWSAQDWERSVTGLSAVTLFVWFLCWAHCEKCPAGWVTSWNQDRWEKQSHEQQGDQTSQSQGKSTLNNCWKDWS